MELVLEEETPRGRKFQLKLEQKNSSSCISLWGHEHSTAGDRLLGYFVPHASVGGKPCLKFVKENGSTCAIWDL